MTIRLIKTGFLWRLRVDAGRLRLGEYDCACAGWSCGWAGTKLRIAVGVSDSNGGGVGGAKRLERLLTIVGTARRANLLLWDGTAEGAAAGLLGNTNRSCWAGV